MNTGIPQEEFENMLTLIQSFYPPGVGARDLRECLLIQLKREGKQNSLEYKIISEHMQDLGKRRFPEIARKMGLSAEQVQKCANNIAQLDPRPGQIFAESPQNYVLPDVTVEKIDGEYQISLNGEQIPHLRISNTYKDIMSQDGNGSEVKDYIRDKIRSGKFLIKSIHQRQQTISNIAHQIVSRQREFLDHGSAHLKPMTMVQIADAVGVHETTVSRAISGKYMSTPQGVFEMKYFFTPGYQTSSGEAMSNTSVKEAIDGPREKRGRQLAAQRQGDRRDPERARHSDRPPHRREIPHRAEHSAEQHAAEVLAATGCFASSPRARAITLRAMNAALRAGDRRMARACPKRKRGRINGRRRGAAAEADAAARPDGATARERSDRSVEADRRRLHRRAFGAGQPA